MACNTFGSFAVLFSYLLDRCVSSAKWHKYTNVQPLEPAPEQDSRRVFLCPDANEHTADSLPTD